MPESAGVPTLELRFQFRYAAALPPRWLQLDQRTLWLAAAGSSSAPLAARRKVEKTDITQALAGMGHQARHNQLRHRIII
jgi:hypothetical protein